MVDALDNLTPGLRRAWHVVATSDEVGGDPVQVWLLGQAWCLVRLGGRLVAWVDRCPHRLAPLSAGSVVGDELQCGYHGWRFEAGGRVTTIPAVPTAPPRRACATPAWGVTERFGLVWLAPEEPEAGIHDFPEWDADGFDRDVCELVRSPAGAGLLIDNFLDAAHFPYVHAATFGTDEAAPVHDDGVERDGWVVATTFDTRYREAGEVQRQLLVKRASASLSVYLHLGFPDTGLRIGILFCCTPELADRTRIYKLVARNDIAGDPSRLKSFVAEEDVILAEDLRILERYDHRDLPLDRTAECHTRADRLSLAWRSVMAELVST